MVLASVAVWAWRLRGSPALAQTERGDPLVRRDDRDPDGRLDPRHRGHRVRLRCPHSTMGSSATCPRERRTTTGTTASSRCTWSRWRPPAERRRTTRSRANRAASRGSRSATRTRRSPGPHLHDRVHGRGGHERLPRPRRAVLERDRRAVGGAGRPRDRHRRGARRRSPTSRVTPGRRARPRPCDRQTDPRRDGPRSRSETSSRSRRSRWWWRSRRERWRNRTHSWSSRGASAARSRGRRSTLGVVRRAPAAADRRMRLALLDPRPRSPVRGLAGRPDDGQPHRRVPGGAAVRARRRPGGVRAAGGPPARARWARSSTSRRTRSTSRRRSWTWRSAAT